MIFNVAAECIASSDEPDKEQQVLALFETMEGIGCETNLISFNILIKTCALATGSDEKKRRALQYAASTFESLPSTGLKRDSATYTSMFNAIINLMDDSAGRTNALSSIFRQCCKEGRLNQHIVNILTEAVSDGDLLSITGASSIEEAAFSSLPREWSSRSSDGTSQINRL